MRAVLLLLLPAVAIAADIPLADGSDNNGPFFRRATPLSQPFEPPEDLILAADPDADSTNVPAEADAAKAGFHWLGLVDAGEYSKCYHFLAPFIQENYEEMHWIDILIGQRKPLGLVIKRQIAFVQHKTNMEGGPPGRYMVLHYVTEFGIGNRLEMVTLYQDQSENWRVAGYGIADTES